eukprot:gene27410-33105_t
MEKSASEVIVCEVSLASSGIVDSVRHLLVELTRIESTTLDSTKSVSFLCLATIPDILIPREVLRYFEHFIESIHLFRLVRDATDPTRYLGLLAVSTAVVDDFVSHCQSHILSSLLNVACDLRQLRSLVVQDGDSQVAVEDMFAFLGNIDSQHPPDPHTSHFGRLSISSSSPSPQPPTVRKSHTHFSPHLQEEIYCPVCLEPFSQSVPHKFTTHCRHSFHLSCVFRLQSAACPVCRFVHESNYSSEQCVQCSECGVGDLSSLFICLVCGQVTCSVNNHHAQHYSASMHSYAMQLSNHSVYDFAGQGFVHRLVLASEDDGDAAATAATSATVASSSAHKHKVMEVSSAHHASSFFRDGSSMPSSDEVHGQLVHRKLEEAVLEYNRLLAWQLQQNRLWFEEQVAIVRRALADFEESKDGGEEGEDSGQMLRWVAGLQQTLQRDNRNVKRQEEALTKRRAELLKENTELKEIQMGLLDNQEEWKRKVQGAQKAYEELKTKCSAEIDVLKRRLEEIMSQL